MNIENLLTKIGFDTTEIRDYLSFRRQISDSISEYSRAYMSSQIEFEQALQKVYDDNTNLHQYTLDLLFVIECFKLLEDEYIAQNIDIKIFVDSMKDVKYKLDECKRVKNVFGTFVADWYQGFLKLNRFALGRLQFDISKHDSEDIIVSNHIIKRDDFILYCHIPSAGPLKPELYMESFKMAHAFFKDRLNSEVLPIMCWSWLLYPNYRKVFSENSNIGSFISNFEILSVRDLKEFNDAWRVFGMDMKDDILALPSKTILQKNFIKYIEEGNGFGDATGVLLFDGNKILTKQIDF